MDPKQIQALKSELQKDLEALERVEKLMAAKSGQVTQSPPPSRTVESAVPDGDDDDTSAPANSLRGTVEQLVNSTPDKRWTAQQVLRHLQQAKYPLRAKQPIYSIGQTLNVLTKHGKIRLVRRGSGSEPHIYKGKAPLGPEQNGVAHNSEQLSIADAG